MICRLITLFFGAYIPVTAHFSWRNNICQSVFHFSRTVRSFCGNRMCYSKARCQQRKMFLKGVLQGTVLGLLLFLTYFNDPPPPPPSETKLCANDSHLFHEIKSQQVCQPGTIYQLWLPIAPPWRHSGLVWDPSHPLIRR